MDYTANPSCNAAAPERFSGKTSTTLARAASVLSSIPLLKFTLGLCCALLASTANAQQSSVFTTTEPGGTSTQKVEFSYDSASESFAAISLCADFCDAETGLPAIRPGGVLKLPDGAQWSFDFIFDNCEPVIQLKNFSPIKRQSKILCTRTYSVSFTAPADIPSTSVSKKYSAELRAAIRDVELPTTFVIVPLIATYEFQAASPALVEFTSQSLSGDEGSVLPIPVRRSGEGSELDGSLLARVFLLNSDLTTASNNSDYSWSDQNVIWDHSEEGVKNLRVSLREDNLLEKPEIFFLGIEVVEGNGVVGQFSVLQITINDIPPPDPGIIRFANATDTVAEDAESIDIVVQRVNGAAGALSVVLATVDGSALADEDYTAVSQTLTWPDGDTTNRIVSIPISEDSLQEADEDFSIELRNPAGDGEVAVVDTMTVTINDIAPPDPGVIRFANTTDTVAEDAGSIDIVVQRVDGSDGELSVSLTTGNDSAEAGSDYTAISQILKWEDGDSADKTVSIPIILDSIQEADEVFNVYLASPQDAESVVSAAQATMRITISDVPPAPAGSIRFAGASQQIDENAGSVMVSVQRVGGSSGALSVSVSTVDGSATSGSDYTGLAAPQILTWADNDSSDQQISIPITLDNQPEDNETFSLRLQAEDEGVITQPDTHTVTIVDVSSPGLLSFNTAAITVDEEDETVAFSVVRSGGSDGAVSVRYSTVADSATADEDFIAGSGTLNWAAGESGAKQVQIALLADNLDEPQEQFFVQLSQAQPLGDDILLGSPELLTVTIAANSAPSPGTVSLSQAAVSIDESGGTVTLDAVRSGGSSGALQVTVRTQPGTATAGTDYTAIDTVLNWADGESGGKTIAVPIIDDSVFEANETFSIDLLSANPAVLGTIATTLVTIENDDIAEPEVIDAGTLSLLPATIEASEADGSVNLGVSRSGGNSGAISVEYTLSNGTAIGGEDFVDSSGVLSWADGETASKTLTIELLSDDLEEQTETFTVVLSNETAPENHVLTIANRNATVSITDATERGTIRLLDSELRVGENDGSVTVSAERSGGSDGAIDVAVQILGLSAEAGSDFINPQARLAWDAGSAGVRSVEIPILRDQIREDDEAFTVSILPGGQDVQIDPQANQTVVVIEDNTLDADQAYNLSVFSGNDQLAVPGDVLSPLVVAVRRNDEESALQSAINIGWRVEPAGAARLLDGETTRSDGNGQSANRVEVLSTGFIRVIATALGTDEEIASTQRSSRIDPPVLNLPPGQTAFTIRSGLEGIPGLSLNQSRTAAALDDACAALAIAAQTDSSLTPAQQDLLQTCQTLDQSNTLADDLDVLAPEELFAITDSIIDTVDIQVTNIYTRINALRSGQYDQLDLSQLQLQIYDQLIPGSVLDAAQNAMTQTDVNTAVENDTNPFSTRFGVFASGSLSSGEIDGDGRQQDADVSTSGLTVGADYRLRDQFVLGAGLGFVQNETEFSNVEGGAKIDGLSLLLFGTWYENDKGYVDLVIEAGQNSYDMQRQISLSSSPDLVMAAGDTDASIFSFNLSAGRNFNFSGLELGPYLRLGFTSASVDGYREQASSSGSGFGSTLDIRSHTVRSTSLTIGAQIAKSLSTGFGVLLPQFRFEYETENETRKEGISASFQADPNDTAFTVSGTERDESYINLGLGSSILLANGKSGFAFYETRLQHDYITQHWLKLGFRMEF